VSALRRAATQRTGTWLNVPPRAADQLYLAPKEFRDALAVRYGRQVVQRPRTCDGCPAPFSEVHAMSCPTGGLPTIAHDEIQEFIFNALDGAGARGVVRHPVVKQALRPGDRGIVGDLAVRGLLRPQITEIIDVKLISMAAAHRLLKPAETLLDAEDARWRRHYSRACDAQRYGFIPFVVGTDGCMSKGAHTVMCALAAMIAAKSGAKFSRVAGVLKAKLQFTIARAVSNMVRASRRAVQAGGRDPLPLDDAAAVQSFRAPLDDTLHTMPGGPARWGGPATGEGGRV
jgi:hypothetical protein